MMLQGRVATLEISELFNMTELRYIHPYDTTFISVSRLTPSTLRIKFRVRQKAMDTKIYQVHAFRYWDNLTQTPSLMEYQGREYVLWNKTSNCVKGVDKPIDRAVLDQCSEDKHRDPDLNTWRNIITTNDIYHNNVVSNKHSTRFNYVYCFPWNISIGKETVRCPMMPVKLDSSISFQVGNYSYLGLERTIVTSYADPPFIEDVSQAHFDADKVASNNLILFDRIQELQKDNQKLLDEQQTSLIITKNGSTYYAIMICTGVLVLICVGLIAHILRITKSVRSTGKIVKTELQELKKIYEPTSCINCANKQTTIVTTPGSSNAVPAVAATNQPVNINFNQSRPLPPIHEDRVQGGML